MDCAEIQKSELVTTIAPSSANPPSESCICVDASFPCSPSSGNSPLLLCADKALPSPARLEFMQSFVNTLLPQLKRIHSRSPSISPQAKFSAVRVAADMSLAVSATGRSNNIWSKALLHELSRSSGNARRNHRRYPLSHGSKIYARILRRCNVSRNRSGASGLVGMNLQGCGRTSRNSDDQASGEPYVKCVRTSSFGSWFSGRSLEGGHAHAVSHCRKGLHTCRMRHARLKRQCGLGQPSYVKVLRNLRVVAKVATRKAAAEPSKVQSLPQIRKEQIAILGGLIPGGHNMDVPLLFQEAADYILSLQMQVEALQTLSGSV